MLSACIHDDIVLVKELLRKGAPTNFSNEVMKRRCQEMKLPSTFLSKAYSQGINLCVWPLPSLADLRVLESGQHLHANELTIMVLLVIHKFGS